MSLRLFIGLAALAIAMVAPLGAARMVLAGIVMLFAPRRDGPSLPGPKT